MFLEYYMIGGIQGILLWNARNTGIENNELVSSILGLKIITLEYKE